MSAIQTPWCPSVGDRVYVDTDNEDWGRVTGPATILLPGQRAVLLEVDSIRATICAPVTDIQHEEEDN